MNWVIKDNLKNWFISNMLGVTSCTSVESASLRLIELLYKDIPAPEKPVSLLIPMMTERDEVIYTRYMAGERAVNLAEEYGVSLQRLHWLLRRYKSLSSK